MSCHKMTIIFESESDYWTLTCACAVQTHLVKSVSTFVYIFLRMSNIVTLGAIA